MYALHTECIDRDKGVTVVQQVQRETEVQRSVGTLTAISHDTLKHFTYFDRVSVEQEVLVDKMACQDPW